jgi:hypothetical protein
MVGHWAFETIWRNRANQDFKTSIFSGLCLISAAISGVIFNPVGWNRLWAPFSLQTNFWSIAITDEMWPIPLHWYWAMGSSLVFGCYLWFSSRAQQRPFWLLVMLLATALLALVSQRHMNLLGCVMLLLLVFRLKSDPDEIPLDTENSFALNHRTVVSLTLITALSALLLLLARREREQWRHGKWATLNQHYAPSALDELHRREPQGAPFLAGILVSAYAQGKPEYHLRPLLDTGLSRFSNDTAKFFFYLENQPPALRQALNLLKANYIVVNEQNAHWAAALNSLPDWSVIFVSANGILYQRRDSRVKNSIALKESVIRIVPQLKEKKKTTAGAFYTMGLVSPEYTFDLLGSAERNWWQEPNINFMLDWLNRTPAAVLNKAMSRLSPENPSQLRLRILLALRLGLSDEAQSLYKSSKLLVHDLEDAALRAEVLLSTHEPCASRKAVTSVFPRRRWSVRLAEVVNRINELCRPASNEPFASSKIQELVWSEEVERWMRRMSHELNQRILANRKAE